MFMVLNIVGKPFFVQDYLHVQPIIHNTRSAGSAGNITQVGGAGRQTNYLDGLGRAACAPHLIAQATSFTLYKPTKGGDSGEFVTNLSASKELLWKDDIFPTLKRNHQSRPLPEIA